MGRRGFALLAVALAAAACTSGGSAARGTTTTSAPSASTTTTSPPVVLTSATPRGWVPVDFGDAQISVPPAWNVVYDPACPFASRQGSLFVGSVGYGYCPADLGPEGPSVTMAALPTTAVPRPGTTRETVNGLAVWVAVSPGSSPVYEVPELGIELTFVGRQALAVLATLTRSPALVAGAAGTAPSVPASWRWVTGGDVRVAVPVGWPTTTGGIEGLFCTRGITLVSPDVVLIDGDVFGPNVVLHCPLMRLSLGPVRPANGLVVDLHPKPGWPPSAKLGRCLDLHGLTACLYDRTPTGTNDRAAALDILFVQVTVPGHAGHELLEIGLAGDGLVARTILYSLRPA